MLTISGLKNFYYLPTFHDMRCKARRVSEIIRTRYHRDPLNGDVYIFMSKDQKKVKMIHYERHAYYLHEKSFTNDYRFMKIELQDGVTISVSLYQNKGHERGRITRTNINEGIPRAAGICSCGYL